MMETAREQPGPMDQDRAASRHVLLVDDEAISALALQRYLARKGFRVTTAVNGVQALDLARQDPADLVITDMRMPRMGGRELIRVLREEREQLPVIVITGYTTTDAEAAGLTGPNTLLMTKPLDPERLLAAARSLLGGD